MVYRLGVFLTFLLLTPNISKTHAVYVSVCNVYETKEGSFFSIRMFKDDIFDALGYVGSSKEIKNDQWNVFIDYVNKNFGVTMNGEKMSLKLNKFEFEGSDYTETLNIVLMGKPLNPSGDVFIKNTLLFDAIDGQMNVISAKIGDNRKTLTFKKTPKIRWEKII